MALRRVPINLASEEQLKSLPGIGPRTAKAIIDFRENVGPLTEHTLPTIPYIRISRDLLDLVDFTTEPTASATQQDEIDRLVQAVDRANLKGPSFNRSVPTSPYKPTDTYFPSVPAGLSAMADMPPYYSYTNNSSTPWTDRLGYAKQSQSPYLKPRMVMPAQPVNTYSTSNDGAYQKKMGFLPKTLLYDGKTNWRAFYTKFSKYAEAQHWSAKECKDNLCWCLTGKANDFFANFVEGYDNLEYFDIIKKFEKRFGYQDLPETATIAFNISRQETEEDLDDWADRVLTLATKAFRDLPEEYMYKQAILRFCHGCINKEAGEQAANARPTTMEMAVDKVKWAIHTHNAVHGRTRRDVKQICSPENYPEYPVYTLKQEMKQPVPSRLDNLESTVEDMKGKMNTMNVKYDRLMDKLDKFIDRFSSRQSRSPSPSPSRSPSSIKCFRCKGNHYVKDCPEPKLSQLPKAVQFTEEQAADPLNEGGSAN